jgi:hypothetical protein
MTAMTVGHLSAHQKVSVVLSERAQFGSFTNTVNS